MAINNRPMNASGAPCVAQHHLAAWADIVARSRQAVQAEQLAGYGSWWFDCATSELALSGMAAALLGVTPGRPLTLAQRSFDADWTKLDAVLRECATGGALVDREVRLIDPLDGVRWLRVRSVPSTAPSIAAGIFIDVTDVKQAAMREKFSFALTQFLIGSDSLAEAVTRIIKLVCEDLGWEWGAYWNIGLLAEGRQTLHCRHTWRGDDERLAPFQRTSEAIDTSVGDGVAGRVWRSGEAEWVDISADDPAFLRGAAARSCGLRSGYLFPVTYMTADGKLHRPGVLEFFSYLPRQREAQLPELSASIGAVIAMTAQKMVQQERIRRLALIDELTGLANRNHFHSLVDAACDTDDAAPFALLYIDLDQFKPINDAFGHQAGNVVLGEFARRLRAVVPAGCHSGRLGGDEFAILASPQLPLAEVDVLAERVLQVARQPFIYEGNELSVSASIGISSFPSHGANTAVLLHAADAAMYVSKRNGRNLATHFQDDGQRQQIELAEQLTLLSELHHAHDRDEFFLEYQPIFDGRDGRIKAVEALIRWRRQDGEVVPPGRFIPVAEKSRLIVRLGRWVAEQACRDLPRMHAAGMRDVQVHINMAAPEFLDEELPAQLLAIVQEAHIEPGSLCLELTENIVMSCIEKSLPIMHELARLGFGISLDDFGMGYSSLSMLKALPIGSIKIDRLFMQGVPNDRSDCAIVRAVLDLGRHMKLTVIAEGVETDQQLGYLRQFGCTSIQGFLLGRPMGLPALIDCHRNRILNHLENS